MTGHDFYRLTLATIPADAWKYRKAPFGSHAVHIHIGDYVLSIIAGAGTYSTPRGALGSLRDYDTVEVAFGTADGRWCRPSEVGVAYMDDQWESGECPVGPRVPWEDVARLFCGIAAKAGLTINETNTAVRA